MPTIWLTYAWADNDDGDVDFVAQELIHAGVQVKLDRWNLSAGHRLWEQIASFIQHPDECNAWMIYATQQSLSSEPCREELAYGLGRALNSRGEAFPVIALFPTAIDISFAQPALTTRLCVSLLDPDWKERVVAAAEGRAPAVRPQPIEPYTISYHQSSKRRFIEIRPRVESWSPFFVAIPTAEKDDVEPFMVHGPRGRVPGAAMIAGSKEFSTPDGNWWVLSAQNLATPVESYYLQCNRLPSEIRFGELGGSQYHYRIQESPSF